MPVDPQAPFNGHGTIFTDISGSGEFCCEHTSLALGQVRAHLGLNTFSSRNTKRWSLPMGYAARATSCAAALPNREDSFL
ncbi:hypothetical protein V3C99_018669 [Haemonchus contortus]|nr:unnamed protein product [Haemonchus contortus]